MYSFPYTTVLSLLNLSFSPKCLLEADKTEQDRQSLSLALEPCASSFLLTFPNLPGEGCFSQPKSRREVTKTWPWSQPDNFLQDGILSHGLNLSFPACAISCWWKAVVLHRYGVSGEKVRKHKEIFNGSCDKSQRRGRRGEGGGGGRLRTQDYGFWWCRRNLVGVHISHFICINSSLNLTWVVSSSSWIMSKHWRGNLVGIWHSSVYSIWKYEGRKELF